MACKRLDSTMGVGEWWDGGLRASGGYLWGRAAGVAGTARGFGRRKLSSLGYK